MRKRLASLVYPVFRHALRLKDRLRYAHLDMAREQNELKKLVNAVRAGGASHANREEGMRPGAVGAAGPGDEAFGDLGYPLTCWLDEIFLDPTSPWKEAWNEHKLETLLYASNDRAWKFWEQARKAEARGDADALEVFYLCVMLGYRGKFPEDPAGLRDWRERLENLLEQGRASDWPGKPPELPVPPTDVPPLLARERLRWVLLAFALVGGGTVVAAAFRLIYGFRGN
jgi:type IV/VI secretion system ImpK/VasF family protein